MPSSILADFPDGTVLYVATPAWYEAIPKEQQHRDAWAVPYFLHEYLQACPAPMRCTSDISQATHVYVAAYVHLGVLTENAAKGMETWLFAGEPTLAVQGGKTVDLSRPLNEGRVFMTAFGPDQCGLVRGEMRKARMIYFDKGFGTCDENWGIMAPTVANMSGHGMLTASGAARQRTTEIFFYGHIPKPYVDFPASTVRYRIWKHLKDVPGSVVGGIDVSGTVNPYTVEDPNQVCDTCNYQCKTCYFDPQFTAYVDAPRLAQVTWDAYMASSNFCVVARGDDPLTPKLTESVLSGCIPLIVIDGNLPLESLIDYSKLGVRLELDDVLHDPASLLSAAQGVAPPQREAYRASMAEYGRLLEYGRGDGMGAERAIAAMMLSLAPQRPPADLLKFMAATMSFDAEVQSQYTCPMAGAGPLHDWRNLAEARSRGNSTASGATSSRGRAA